MNTIMEKWVADERWKMLLSVNWKMNSNKESLWYSILIRFQANVQHLVLDFCSFIEAFLGNIIIISIM